MDLCAVVYFDGAKSAQKRRKKYQKSLAFIAPEWLEFVRQIIALSHVICWGILNVFASESPGPWRGRVTSKMLDPRRLSNMSTTLKDYHNCSQARRGISNSSHAVVLSSLTWFVNKIKQKRECQPKGKFVIKFNFVSLLHECHLRFDHLFQSQRVREKDFFNSLHEIDSRKIRLNHFFSDSAPIARDSVSDSLLLTRHTQVFLFLL